MRSISRTAWDDAARLSLAAVLLFPLGACSRQGAEPNAFEVRSFVRILPPEVKGPELELRGTARDEKGKPLANCVLVLSLEAPDAGTIIGRLRTDEYGRYGVRTVFPRSRAGVPALLEIQFGEPYRAAAVLALAAPGGTGSAANGYASVRGRDGVYRLTHDVVPGFNGPGTGYALADSLLARPGLGLPGLDVAPGPRSERGRQIARVSAGAPR